MEKLGLNVIPEQIRIFEKEAELSPQLCTTAMRQREIGGTG
jgi:hypothetical protein